MPFTAEDDDLLIMHHAMKPSNYSRKKIEEELGEKYPQHSYNSWQERYKRGRGGPAFWDPLITAKRAELRDERILEIKEDYADSGLGEMSDDAAMKAWQREQENVGGEGKRAKRRKSEKYVTESTPGDGGPSMDAGSAELLESADLLGMPVASGSGSRHNMDDDKYVGLCQLPDLTDAVLLQQRFLPRPRSRPARNVARHLDEHAQAVNSRLRHAHDAGRHHESARCCSRRHQSVALHWTYCACRHAVGASHPPRSADH